MVWHGKASGHPEKYLPIPKCTSPHSAWATLQNPGFRNLIIISKISNNLKHTCNIHSKFLSWAVFKIASNTQTPTNIKTHRDTDRNLQACKFSTYQFWLSSPAIAFVYGTKAFHLGTLLTPTLHRSHYIRQADQGPLTPSLFRIAKEVSFLTNSRGYQQEPFGLGISGYPWEFLGAGWNQPGS